MKLLCLFLPFLTTAQPALLSIPGGTFRMGDKEGNSDEKPEHEVSVGAFWMARTETTLADFRKFVAASGYSSDAERFGGSYVWDSLGWHQREGVHWRHDERGVLRKANEGAFPVLHLSWQDAAHYCNWLSRRENLPEVYLFQNDSVLSNPNTGGYRLPTEAEWEYAAALGEEKLGWYAGNAHGRAKTVGQKSPNALGIFDLSGNVWEWCHDWYDGRFYAGNSDGNNPVGPANGKERCLRGGSWNNSPAHCRITNRTSRFPDFRDGSIGFRVVRPVNHE
jgi:formylglycine-generating enzyme required for sulfatase activity